MLTQLTANELFYIDDSITLLTENPPPSSLRGTESNAKIAVPGNLMLKIGGAILEVLNENKEKVPIDLTIDDVLLLREITQSFVKYGSEAVGLELKKKMYTIILQLNAETDFFGDSEEDDKLLTPEELKRLMVEFNAQDTNS